MNQDVRIRYSDGHVFVCITSTSPQRKFTCLPPEQAVICTPSMAHRKAVSPSVWADQIQTLVIRATQDRQSVMLPHLAQIGALRRLIGLGGVVPGAGLTGSRASGRSG